MPDALIRTRPQRAGVALVVVLLVATMPTWIGWTQILTDLDATFIAINTVIVVGLVVLVGHSGQVSIGQGAFYGVAAYTSAVLSVDYGWPTLLAALAALIVTVVVAAIVALPALRLSGHFLALATLGLGLIAQVVFTQSEITGRALGISGIPNLSLFGWEITSDTGFLLLCWAAALLAMVVGHNIVNSRTGRAMRALSDSPAAAASSGIVLGRYKLMAFMISGAFAAVAGSLYAHTVSFGLVSPSPFGISSSIIVLIMVVVGGIRSVWAAPLGAAVVTALESGLERFIPKLVPSAAGDFQIIGFGLILVVFLTFAPDGLAGIFSRARRSMPGLAGDDASAVAEHSELASDASETRASEAEHSEPVSTVAAATSEVQS